MKKIKTIDVQAKEWFDKVNGNSYFSAIITTNFGLPNAKQFNLPFQYGYGSHYIDMAAKKLQSEGIIKDNNPMLVLWSYCNDNKIVLRTSKQENCKKRELMY